LTLINLSSAQNRKTVRDHTIDTFDRFQFARDLAFNLKTICSDRATAVTAESAAAIDSLAVLPLANAGGNPDTEYLSDGITESLINSLSQIPNLRVVPRSSAFRYKGAAIEPKKAGRQLKVRALLTGKVLQRGDALTVQVELVDVKKNSLFRGNGRGRRNLELGQLTSKERVLRKLCDEFAKLNACYFWLLFAQGC